MSRLPYCEEYTPSTLDTYPFPNPYQHVNTVTMSELIITSSAYIINGDSPMTSVANTVAMTTLAVHTLQPHIFYSRGGVFKNAHAPMIRRRRRGKERFTNDQHDYTIPRLR